MTYNSDNYNLICSKCHIQVSKIQNYCGHSGTKSNLGYYVKTPDNVFDHEFPINGLSSCYDIQK